jgi:hypothetical protein
MATQKEVREYLAYWFQLGKKVLTGNGQASFLPVPVLKGDGYSEEFEECWQKIISQTTGECYLDGTYETISELLTPAWELLPCGRCQMPIPKRNLGMPALLCPCNDLPTWPNSELPAPRTPVNTQSQLMSIRNRIESNYP